MFDFLQWWDPLALVFTSFLVLDLKSAIANILRLNSFRDFILSEDDLAWHLGLQILLSLPFSHCHLWNKLFTCFLQEVHISSDITHHELAWGCYRIRADRTESWTTEDFMLFDQMSLHFACLRVPSPTIRVSVLFSGDINAQILSRSPERLYYEKKPI